MIAEGVDGSAEATLIAQRLLRDLARPIELEGATLHVLGSIGIAVTDGSDVLDAESLLRDADLAVYQAKSEGPGRLRLSDDDLRMAKVQRADTEQAIRTALSDDEMALFYQPIVDHTGEAVGFEALIRWHRPDVGMVNPDEFIPLAERSDLILMVDRWVIDAAAKQVSAWDDAGQFVGLPVSVNISGRHLVSRSFVEDVLTPLQKHSIRPERLIVEITESALLEDLESAASKLEVLRSHGVRVAIDDFGTGFTSLAHLRSLPIDILKIDRSFTNDRSAETLVQLIIDTGHFLGATITAEGIETVQQATTLIKMGADELQGYLYGRPKPSYELEDQRIAKNARRLATGC